MPTQDSSGQNQSVALPVTASFMHMVSGSSNKFYTIVNLSSLRPNTHAIMYGRHGTLNPQIMLVTSAEAGRKRQEKLAKGYVHHNQDSFDDGDTRRFAALVKRLRDDKVGDLAAASGSALIHRQAGRLVLSYSGQAAAALPSSSASTAPASLTLSDMFNTYVIPGATT